MKKILFVFGLAVLSVTCCAETAPDTILIEQSAITKWIADSTRTAKGTPTIKYYCLYKGQLVGTNRTTIQTITLCNKYNATCKLLLVTSKTGKRRIICK